MNETLGFDNPWALCALFVFVPLALFDIFSRAGKRGKKLPPALRKRIIWSTIFYRIFLACLITALAGPHWGTSLAADVYRRGLDAVIALDVSRSMEIEDVPVSDGEVSRLERGLALAREAAAALPGVRFAIAVSRSRGIVTVPLTWDTEAALAFLDSLDGSSLTGRGTNLESLLDSAASSFQSSFPSKKVIVLVSDGEALSGSLKAAADRCAANDIMIASIALGSDTGRPVPGMEGIVSRRDFALMRMAAERSGGLCINGNEADAGTLLVSYLRSLAPENNTGRGRREPAGRWRLFVIAAIIAYGLYKICPFALRGTK